MIFVVATGDIVPMPKYGWSTLTSFLGTKELIPMDSLGADLCLRFVILLSMGENIFDGIILRWLKVPINLGLVDWCMID